MTIINNYDKDPADIGSEIYDFAKLLWPLNRSITGKGVRQSLNIIKEDLTDLNIVSVASGTKVFDWEVPLEWHIEEAYIITPNGEKICDFAENNLHILGYSEPFMGKLSLEELQNHLYSLPEQPNDIPYVTSYYKRRWGFCITQQQRETLAQGEYEVIIKSKLFKGCLNYGELLLKGESEAEILISTNICHPSMANNELSGLSVTTFIAKWLSSLPKRYYSYRIIFIPETIGSITYISKHLQQLQNKVVAGYTLVCVGDERAFSFTQSRSGITLSDIAAKHVLKWLHPDCNYYSWLERASDERQFCAPGVDLPISAISRSRADSYPEYHTSLDKLGSVVTKKGLKDSYLAIKKIIQLIERNKTYKVNVFCEPHLSKHGLYPSLSTKDTKKLTRLMMNFISYCDGTNSLLEIADKVGVPAWDLYDISDKLLAKSVISETDH